MTATPFSYVLLNDASVDLNEVYLHITYLFLKRLVFVSDIFLLALLSHENLHSLPEVVSRVFSPELTPLVIQQSPPLTLTLFIYVLFYLFIYFIVIANIYFFQINRLESSFVDSIFRFHDSISISRFRVLVLPDEQLSKAFEAIM